MCLALLQKKMKNKKDLNYICSMHASETLAIAYQKAICENDQSTKTINYKEGHLAYACAIVVRTFCSVIISYWYMEKKSTLRSILVDSTLSRFVRI
jgi:hypothetical protein